MKITTLLIVLVPLLVFCACTKSENVDIEEENKVLVRNWFEEGWNKHNPDIIDEYFADNYFTHDMNMNREAFKQFFVEVLVAFPDIHFTTEDLLAEGDKVVHRWTFTATHQGEFNGVAATGKKITATGIDISRQANGKFIENWGNWDGLGTFQQMGVYPPIISNE